MRRFVVAAFFCLICGNLLAENLKTPPELANKWDAAIAKLEAKDYEILLKTFADPDDLKKILSANLTIADVAKSFSGAKADELLGVLKSLKDKSPEKSEDGGKILIYSVEMKTVPFKEIRFIKVGDEWYLKNN